MLLHRARQAAGRRSQAERSQATRTALIDAARAVFADPGYEVATAAEVARSAGVSTGALYHHFGGKRDLFLAAFVAVEAGLAGRVAAAARTGANPWDRLERGVLEYLAACHEPEVRRLVLVDGPSVLGLDTWRRIDEAHHLRPLRAALASAMRVGLIPARPPDPLARILLGALTEAGLAVDSNRSDGAEEAALWLFQRLRQPPELG